MLRNLKAIITPTDLDPFDFPRLRDDFFGLNGNEPIFSNNDRIVEYTFHPKNHFVDIKVTDIDEAIDISFPTTSGDWFVGTLTECGNYLVLAEPYNIEVFHFA